MRPIDVMRARGAASGGVAGPGLYRHYRILITATNGGPNLALNEVKLSIAANGGDETSSGGTIAASGDYYAFSGAKAFDNLNSGTNNWGVVWSGGPEWLRYDFGAGVTKQIDDVFMWPESANSYTNTPKDFLIQGSNDASTSPTNWTTIAAFTNVTGWDKYGAAGGFRRFNLSGVVDPYYWDIGNKSPSATLSESKLRLITSTSGWRGVLSVTGHDSGFHYAEIVRVGATSWACNSGLGTIDADVNNYGGATANSICVQTEDGGQSRVLRNGAQVGTKLAQITNGGYTRVAYDAASGKVWLGNETNWFGGGDPAAGTSPTYTFTAGTKLFLFGNSYQESARARVALADFGGTPPVGSSPWG